MLRKPALMSQKFPWIIFYKFWDVNLEILHDTQDFLIKVTIDSLFFVNLSIRYVNTS